MSLLRSVRALRGASPLRSVRALRGASPLRVVAAGSAAGLRLRARIAARLDGVLDPKVEREARRIVRAVRRGGEAAVLELVRELDGIAADSLAELRLAPLPEDVGWPAVDGGLRAAIELAIDNAEAFHREARSAERSIERGGAVIERRIRPVARAGIYVPGGRASYPSTAILTVVPARVAGVSSIAVATPAKAYRESPALRYTLDRLGIDEIWGIGGATAIAGFAFGCGELARVDTIAGPGNAWVTAAKRLVAGFVGIDGLMGPSEVVIVAGADADPGLVAADLLAQAEHDPRAAAILVTPSRRLARSTAEEVARQLESLSTGETAAESLRAFGGALVVDGLDEAVAIAAELAPEHLQLVGAEIEATADRFEVAGAIFVGAACPEVFGDYVAGPSHVLPTCGSARFASGLSVATFERSLHRLRVTSQSTARAWGRAAAAIARAEGLPAHAAAAERRVSSAGDSPARIVA